MPPRRPRLIKGLPAPRALSSSRRIFNKILRETVIYSDYAAVCSPDHMSIARHGVENLTPEGRFMWRLEPYMTAAEYKQARAENLVPSEGHFALV